MKAKDLTLAQWQVKIDEFRAANPSAPSAAGFRIDGTQFSTARFYGGMTYNGAKYTTFELKDTPGEFTCQFATIAVREDALRWIVKRLKDETKKDAAQMSGRARPLTCCDRDCALANGCRIGGYQCERCGRWFCGEDLDEDRLCDDCAAERVNEEWMGEEDGE